MRLSSLQVSADGLIPVIIDHALSDAAERLTSVMKRQEEWYRRADKIHPCLFGREKSSEETGFLFLRKKFIETEFSFKIKALRKYSEEKNRRGRRRKKLKTLEKASNFVGKWMALIVLAVAALALFAPQTCTWIRTSWVNYLLGIVMFGMGLTLKASDFAEVFKHPKDVVLGAVCQFTLMPLIAFVLCKVFRLPTELAVGVILVGTCPGGTSSNVMTYLSHGDVPLSVCMTAVSTLLAPIMTPLLTLLYAGQTVDVNVGAMFLSVLRVVMLPIVLGLVVNHFFGKFTEKAAKALPLVSTTAIVMIVAAVVSVNSARLMTVGGLIVAVVVCHNLLGYLTGYLVAKVLRLDTTKCRAISIEVGMQNSGLATSLATTHFAQYPLAAVPGAVFSVWHNISGALLAGFFNYRTRKAQQAEAAGASETNASREDA